MRIPRTLVALALLTGAGTAGANPCRYDAYGAMAVYREIAGVLPELGVAALAGDYLGVHMPAGWATLVRDRFVIGELAIERDARRATAQTTVLDFEGKPLFQVKERAYVCPPDEPAGLCREISIVSEMQGVIDGRPPFLIHLNPFDDWPRFFRYGLPVDLATFREDVRTELTWLYDVLATTDDVLRPAATTPEEKVFWALAGDPLVAPYLGRLTIMQGRPYMVIRGVVPSNLVYGLVIDRTREAGFPYVDPQLIIDTRTHLPPDLGLRTSACF